MLDDNKRYSHRIAVHQPITLHINDSVTIKGFVTDICREGIGMDISIKTEDNIENIDEKTILNKPLKFLYNDEYEYGKTKKEKNVSGHCLIRHIEKLNDYNNILHVGAICSDSDFVKYTEDREIAEAINNAIPV